MKKFAVILSGCGKRDGSEIHESVLLLLAIRQAGCEYSIFAPDIAQTDVINHYSGTRAPEQRNVLEESARIARGNIQPLSRLKVSEFDVIALPGGFGVAKNLCSYAVKGENYTLLPDLEKVLLQAYKSGKPIGATCVAPVLLAKVFNACRITLGDDSAESRVAQKLGADVVFTSNGEAVRDDNYKLVTVPCYMLDADITDIAAETALMVNELLKF